MSNGNEEETAEALLLLLLAWQTRKTRLPFRVLLYRTLPPSSPPSESHFLSLSPPLPKFPNPPLAQTHSKHIPHLSSFSFVSFLFFRFLFSFCLFLFSLFLFFSLLVLLLDEKFLYSFFFGPPAAEAKSVKGCICGATGNAQDRYKILLCNFTGAKNSRM